MEKKKDNIQILKNICYSGFKGYIFGGMVGMFINPKQRFTNTFRSMHLTGLKFMSMSVIYTGTDELLEKYYKKNQLVSSALAGGFGMLPGGFKKSLFGASSFTAYSLINYNFDYTIFYYKYLTFYYVYKFIHIFVIQSIMNKLIESLYYILLHTFYFQFQVKRI